MFVIILIFSLFMYRRSRTPDTIAYVEQGVPPPAFAGAGTIGGGPQLPLGGGPQYPAPAHPYGGNSSFAPVRPRLSSS